MLDYRLQVFREVAELQSVTKAARKLHLSQPAVTKHIQLLEALLGVPLFMSSHRGMTPEARLKAGVSDSLIRLSVGIEAIEDLLKDLEQAIGG